MGGNESTFDILLEAYQEGCRRYEQDLWDFTEPLYEFCDRLVQPKLPDDWRDQVHAYLDEQEPKGFTVLPEHRPPLEEWIQRLEEYVQRQRAQEQRRLAAKEAEDAGPTIIFDLPPDWPSPDELAAARARDAVERERRRAMYEERNRQVLEAGRAAGEMRSSGATPWPRLTYEQRKRARESTGLPGWYAAALRLPVHSAWETRLEQAGRTARDELLRFFRALAANGRLAQAMGRAEDADFDLLAAGAADVQQSYDSYLKARIAFERVWAEYVEAVWLIDVEVMALAH
jgi:hypothetical protein